MFYYFIYYFGKIGKMFRRWYYKNTSDYYWGMISFIKDNFAPKESDGPKELNQDVMDKLANGINNKLIK